ncbi:hypothetical protein FHR33_003059 [Nonomuraea dietziae]|uniref:Uncharacterized protein n=1 Tax=Nonomuraea dietziae TaxID=65515 RepID=A0A7W5V1R1_9ACTN|nr:hypothetical protein [Nonomuraea dietziae]
MRSRSSSRTASRGPSERRPAWCGSAFFVVYGKPAQAPPCSPAGLCPGDAPRDPQAGRRYGPRRARAARPPGPRGSRGRRWVDCPRGAEAAQGGRWEDCPREPGGPRRGRLIARGNAPGSGERGSGRGAKLRACRGLSGSGGAGRRQGFGLERCGEASSGGERGSGRGERLPGSGSGARGFPGAGSGARGIPADVGCKADLSSVGFGKVRFGGRGRDLGGVWGDITVAGTW